MNFDGFCQTALTEILPSHNSNHPSTSNCFIQLRVLSDGGLLSTVSSKSIPIVAGVALTAFVPICSHPSHIPAEHHPRSGAVIFPVSECIKGILEASRTGFGRDKTCHYCFKYPY